MADEAAVAGCYNVHIVEAASVSVEVWNKDATNSWVCARQYFIGACYSSAIYISQFRDTRTLSKTPGK